MQLRFRDSVPWKREVFFFQLCNCFYIRSLLVTTSKALVTSSDALVTSEHCSFVQIRPTVWDPSEHHSLHKYV